MDRAIPEFITFRVNGQARWFVQAVGPGVVGPGRLDEEAA